MSDINSKFIDFLNSFPDDSGEDFSVSVDDETIISKEGTDYWISSFTLNDPTQQQDNNEKSTDGN